MIVRPRFAACVAAAVVACSATPALSGYKEQMGLTAVESAQLPQFCWAQMGVPNATGPGYEPANCGPGANHYCPGLVYLIRSRKATNKSQRLQLLQHADIDIRYTENWTKDYPQCSIREHVMKSRIEVNNLLQLYGGKPVPAGK